MAAAGLLFWLAIGFVGMLITLVLWNKRLRRKDFIVAALLSIFGPLTAILVVVMLVIRFPKRKKAA